MDIKLVLGYQRGVLCPLRSYISCIPCPSGIFQAENQNRSTLKGHLSQFCTTIPYGTNPEIKKLAIEIVVTQNVLGDPRKQEILYLI